MVGTVVGSLVNVGTGIHMLTTQEHAALVLPGIGEGGANEQGKRQRCKCVFHAKRLLDVPGVRMTESFRYAALDARVAWINTGTMANVNRQLLLGPL